MSRHRSPDVDFRLAPWIVWVGAITGMLLPPVTALAQANAPDATAVADTAAATTATRATFTSLRVPELRVPTPAATPTAKVEHVEAVPVPEQAAPGNALSAPVPDAPTETHLPTWTAPEPTEGEPLSTSAPTTTSAVPIMTTASATTTPAAVTTQPTVTSAPATTTTAVPTTAEPTVSEVILTPETPAQDTE